MHVYNREINKFMSCFGSLFLNNTVVMPKCDFKCLYQTESHYLATVAIYTQRKIVISNPTTLSCKFIQHVSLSRSQWLQLVSTLPQAQECSHFLLTFSMAVSDRECALSLQCSGAMKSVPCQVLSPGVKVTWPSRLTVSVAGLIAKGVSSLHPDAPVHAADRCKVKAANKIANQKICLFILSLCELLMIVKCNLLNYYIINN